MTSCDVVGSRVVARSPREHDTISEGRHGILAFRSFTGQGGSHVVWEAGGIHSVSPATRCVIERAPHILESGVN
jgi:hypothetical protein